MGLKPAEFYDLTLAEYDVISEGHFIRDQRRWQHTRFIGAYLHSQLSGKVITPEKLKPLIFDKPELIEAVETKPPLTKADVLAFEEKYLKVKR